MTNDQVVLGLEVIIMATIIEHCYVTSVEGILGGEPIIRETRTPVRAIVELWRMSTAPEEIPRHLPHLTLAQVFDVQRPSDRNQFLHRTESHPGHVD